MADIVLSPLGQRLRERTQPLAPDDETYDFAHAKLCEGMMLPYAQLAELVDPPDPLLPWEPLFDVDLCPYWALPWLGQIVGIRLPSGLSDEDARNFIKDLGPLKRGSPQAIIAAAKYALTGNKTVILHERDNGDAYLLEVVTLTSETPDPALVLRYVMTQKPAALKLTPRTTDGWLYQDMSLHYTGKKYSDIPAEYRLYKNLTGGPGGA
jgi:hypothetical protein